MNSTPLSIFPSSSGTTSPQIPPLQDGIPEGILSDSYSSEVTEDLLENLPPREDKEKEVPQQHEEVPPIKITPPPIVPTIAIPKSNKQNSILPQSNSNCTTPNSSKLMLTSLKMPIIASIRQSIQKSSTNPIPTEIDEHIEDQLTPSTAKSAIPKKSESSNTEPGMSVNFKSPEPISPQPTSPTSSQMQSAEAEPSPRYTDSELDQALSEVINQKQRPMPEMRSPLIKYAKHLQLDSVSIEDYDRAAELDEAIKFLERNCETAKPKEEPVITIEMRIEQTKQNIQDCEEKYANRIREFEESIKLKMEELQSAHDSEIRLLEAKVSSPEFIHEFDKPSARLLGLRELQRTRALQKDYHGAKEIKRHADALEKEETEIARKRAMRKVKILFTQLTQKHEKEDDCARQNWDRQRIAIELEKEAEISPMRQLLHQLERNGHQVLKYSVRQRNAFGTARENQISFSPTQGLTTPRTKKKVNEIKQKGQTRLNLGGLDVRGVIKTNKPSSRIRVKRVDQY